MGCLATFDEGINLIYGCSTASPVSGNRRVFRIFTVLGGEFPACKGSYRFFIRQDTTGCRRFQRHAGRISLGRNSAWRRLSHRPWKATSEWESPSPVNFLDMGVQLVGQ